jgi:hypothetical protein
MYFSPGTLSRCGWLTLTFLVFLFLWMGPVSIEAETAEENRPFVGAETTGQVQDKPVDAPPQTSGMHPDTAVRPDEPPMDEPPMTDIIDIHPPMRYGIPPSLLQYAAIALAALIMIGLSVFLIKRFLWPRIRQRRKEQMISEKRLPPHEQAFLQLKPLENVEAWQTSGKAFYFELTQVFRGYIHQQYGIDALEMTTEEFLPAVQALQLAPELFSGVRKLFVSCDPIKFADMPVEPEKMRDDLVFVTRFIQQTTPMASSETAENS